MELTSSLLLCALAALVPLTLGNLPPSEIKIDELKMIGKLPVTRTKVMMNPYSLPAAIIQNEHPVLAVPQCQHCLYCIEMAMKSHLRQHKHVSNLPSVEEPYANDILESYHQYKSFRGKRANDKFEGNTPINLTPGIKIRTNKTVTVTKYSNGGQVYALKLKEEDLEGRDLDNETACRVYRVNRYYSCDVPDGDLLMILFGRKEGSNEKTQANLSSSASYHGKSEISTPRSQDDGNRWEPPEENAEDEPY